MIQYKMMRMKKCYLIVFTFLCLAVSKTVSAQQLPVRFSTGDLIPVPNIAQQHFSKDDLAAGAFQAHYFVLLQFDRLPSLQQQDALRLAGIQLGSYIPGNA